MIFDPLDDGKSRLAYFDHMGDDLKSVNMARASVDKVTEYAPDGSVLPKDAKFMGWLADANPTHWTPFSHCVITLHIKMPLIIARQWFKHQVGFTRNEVSRRYVKTLPDLYIPKEFRKASPNIKQGSLSETLENNEEAYDYFTKATGRSLAVYDTLLDMGVCPEQARLVLPVTFYTEFYETASLYGYARLCKHRMEGTAQWEIQQYANAVDKIMTQLYPKTWEALIGEQHG